MITAHVARLRTLFSNLMEQPKLKPLERSKMVIKTIPDGLAVVRGLMHKLLCNCNLPRLECKKTQLNCSNHVHDFSAFRTCRFSASIVMYMAELL